MSGFIKISQMPNLGTIQGNTTIPVVDAATNYTVSVANLSAYLGAGSSYSNANVAAYLPTNTSNIGANIVTANSIVSSTLMPMSGNLVNIASNVIVSGNLQVLGTTTTVNAASISTSNAVITVSDGAVSPSQANGSGLRVSSNDYASITWNSIANTWESSTAVSAVGNITGSYLLGNGAFITGLPAGYSNADVANYLLTNTGNIAAGYFIGDGSQLTGLPAGYSNANVASYLLTNTGNIAAGNISVTGNIAGTELILSSGLFAPVISATGRIFTAGNIQTNGNLLVLGNTQSFGNITAANLRTTGSITATGNIATNGNISATGNVTIAASLSANLIASVTNITAGNTVTANSLSAGGSVISNGTMSAAGNVQAGNLRTAGSITATGNIIGATLSANGSVLAFNNITAGNVLSAVTANILSGITAQSLVLSTTASATGNIQGGNLRTDGVVVASGNIQGNNIAAVNSVLVNGNRAVNGPAFRAYASSATQTIASGTQTRVLFQTEQYDTEGNYASSRFTPSVAGYYQFNSSVRIAGPSGTGERMLVLYKNGAEYARGTNDQGTEIGATFYTMSVSADAFANGTGDYFEIYIQQGSGSNKDLTAVNVSYITWFSGTMIRGA